MFIDVYIMYVNIHIERTLRLLKGIMKIKIINNILFCSFNILFIIEFIQDVILLIKNLFNYLNQIIILNLNMYVL